MSHAIDALNQELSDENRHKRRLMDITHVPRSQLPHRVAKLSTGVSLGMFETEAAMDAFIENYPLEKLTSQPTRRRNR
jgi:hypothetical protein